MLTLGINMITIYNPKYLMNQDYTAGAEDNCKDPCLLPWKSYILFKQNTTCFVSSVHVFVNFSVTLFYVFLFND